MRPIDKEILHIALPSIVSNITVPLLGLVDTAITGHLGSAAYIGAIALGSMLFNVIYWVFAFLRMGTSGLTAQALGSMELNSTLNWLLRSQVIGWGIAVVLLLLQWPLRELGLLIMQPTPEVRELTVTYFNICIWGAPATLGLFGLNGWFIGMQNSRLPMAIAITQNVVNILASLFFVFGLGMKVEGVALGTLIAQWCGYLLGVFIVMKYRGERKEERGERIVMREIFNQKDMSRFFQVNRDIFLRTLCMVCVMMFFTSAGSWQGELTLAVNTLLMQLYLLVSYVMDGFANAGEAMSGKYYGAGDDRSLRLTIRHILLWGAWMAVAFTLLYIIGGKPFLRLLTDEPQVVEAGGVYVWWAYLIPALSFLAFMWDGIFIGLTASRQMLQSMSMAAATFFVLYYLLQPLWGNHGLWAAFLGYMIVRGLMQTWIYRKGKVVDSL